MKLGDTLICIAPDRGCFPRKLFKGESYTVTVEPFWIFPAIGASDYITVEDVKGNSITCHANRFKNKSK